MSSKEKDILVEAFSEMAPDYERKVNSELNRFWGWSYKGFVNELLQRTPIKPEDRILDVATGTGVISHRLASQGVSLHPIHALDITFSMLKHTRTRFKNSNIGEKGELTCASALEMPYKKASFSLVLCGLATHHMEVEKFVGESNRILVPDGRLSIIDAGGSLFWNIPGLKFLLRIATYIYFLVTENSSRAWAESGAISNVLAEEQWNALLLKTGFKEIEITKLLSKHSIIPSPLLVKAIKT